MKIWLKVAFVVLPILFATLVIGGLSSYLVASNGVSRVTTEFLDFKVAELEKYVNGQWDLLAQNGLEGNPVMVQATKVGIETYAKSLIRSDSELIFALDASGSVAMASGEMDYEAAELAALRESLAGQAPGLKTVELGKVRRVGIGFDFAPFDWFVFVSEERDAFYRYLNRITIQTVILIIGGSIFSLVLILLFVRHTMNPLTRMAIAMRKVITSNDLGARVEIVHDDEIGQVSHTFNIMLEELEAAYGTIKQYALEAVVARKNEMKIRHIFQKYVPQELIDRFFANPESMLVGENRNIAILFSDIRGFTSISERMRPDELVSSLNRYFSLMVDIIMSHGGVVDKYIGDAIMAIFGAPVQHDDDPAEATLAGMEMAAAVKEFNAEQRRSGKPEFRIGVGLAYGVVTVGNIGTERKMDYTVIGDTVNLASRLEGLTKVYQQDVILSEGLYEQVSDKLPCRLLDAVAVKGRTKGEKIFAVKKELLNGETRAWTLHNEAMGLYFDRDFARSLEVFRSMESEGHTDNLTDIMIRRCEAYVADPPPEDWNGVEVMKTK